MRDIKQVYFKIEDKKKRKNEISKMIRDELAQNDEYRQLVDEMKTMRERKKSIENQVAASCLSDVAEMDALKLEISNANELISDIALTMYANKETVEILDEEKGVRLTPVFAVKFQKEAIEEGT